MAKLTITKGDFATNKGKYKVMVGNTEMTRLAGKLEINDETVTVTRPTNTSFFDAVYVYFIDGVTFDSGYVEIYDMYDNLQATVDLEYDPSDNSASYQKYQQSVIPNTSKMVIYIKFHELPTPETVPTFNHTYSMTPAELEQLLLEGLGVDTPAGTIDLRDFMLNLLSLPLDVPPDELGEKQPIVLGDYTRETTATTVKGDVLTYNVGSITVPQKYNNAYDFYTAETTLILPYTQNVPLPAEYVIGATVSIEYVVEVYKGTVNINVTSSKTDKPIYNGTTSIGRQIPFVSYWKVLGDESIYTTVYNNQTKASIEVKRKPPLQLENGVDTSEYGTIGDFTGYVEVAEVTLVSSTMGGYEQEQLVSILNKGVIL